MIDQGRAAYSEPLIDLKSRIRYLQQAPDGTIYAKSDPDLFYIVQPDWPGARMEVAGLSPGQAVRDLTARCAQCHLPHESHAGIPNIYGHTRAWFEGAVHHEATSPQANSIMHGIAVALSPKQVQALAEFYRK
jgi:mono/diheme cytochrome c family protein